ncbi:MAG: GDSL-type esterase/lipase family protein [Vicinamibacterales bacterium]
MRRLSAAMSAAGAAGVLVLAAAVLAASQAPGAGPAPAPVAQQWAASWAASPQGPYPSGNAAAQPVLEFAVESAESGALDQSFRLIIRPDLWGAQFRIRFTNAFGTKPVTFDDIYVGLQASGANVVPGTSHRVTFNRGRASVALPPGQALFSDPIRLGFVTAGGTPLLAGRKLALSFHVVGSSGPMTWHAKALTTSYLTAPHSGSHSADEDDDAFASSTTSWYFVDMLDVLVPAGTAVIAAFGDSITDGTASTLNGDDRWPDVLSRRLHATYGSRVSVVNAGIGGNQVLGPSRYSPEEPFSGGPAARDRLDRDVLALSGLSAVVWLEGINDLSTGATAEAVIAGMQDVVRRVRARGVRIVGATITSSLGSSGGSGTAEADERRRAVNAFIRGAGNFDAVADFDAATLDPKTGALRPAFQPNSTTGGAGDRLHPNRAGYLAMGNAINLSLIAQPGLVRRQAHQGDRPRGRLAP